MTYQVNEYMALLKDVVTETYPATNWYIFLFCLVSGTWVQL
jgi:hypothetical protein